MKIKYCLEVRIEQSNQQPIGLFQESNSVTSLKSQAAKNLIVLTDRSQKPDFSLHWNIVNSVSSASQTKAYKYRNILNSM